MVHCRVIGSMLFLISDRVNRGGELLLSYGSHLSVINLAIPKNAGKYFNFKIHTETIISLKLWSRHLHLKLVAEIL